MSSKKVRLKDIAFRPAKAHAASGDIVIVGAGLAGLFTALKLAPVPVTVVAAAPLGEGASSVWAQGGVAAAVGEGDTAEKHAADTIAAGAGIVDEHIANLVAAEASDRIADLVDFGVPFDRDSAGRFLLSREAAHSEKRVVRVAGDRAGAAIMQALIRRVRQTPSIRLLEGFEAVDLTTQNGRVTGLRVKRHATRGNGLFELLPARAVVLATGGIGALYRVTTNPAYARGEALAFAARAGATIADAEMVQFHPTALDVGVDPAPLASEALRGEGALLIDENGRRFMLDAHPLAELAPRDVVARAVAREIAEGRRPFLDCRAAIGARFPEAFPTVHAHCVAAGIDPVTEPIPIAPAEHYHMGGIATDERGRTSVSGLWAVGEVASTGLHGANRLASNSLLEAIVFGARAADDIRSGVGDGSGLVAASLRKIRGEPAVDRELRAVLFGELRQIMTSDVGVVRSRRSLTRALLKLVDLADLGGHDIELANMLLAARFVTAAALMREESRGGHYRADFPEPDAALAKRTFMTLDSLATFERSIAAGAIAQVSETYLACDADQACAP
ncbi:MAG: L-aspartate oxidase [Hyphomicrobiaceae bacterium]